jgi:hypothetical protein
VSDIDTGVVDSLKALDPERPIREADVDPRSCDVAFVPTADLTGRVEYQRHFEGERVSAPN